MNIFAHRGYSFKYTENSALAFEACRDLDIYGVELDVQYSKDAKVIVFHDEYLERMLGVKAFLRDLTYDQLKEYKYADGQSILSLEEYVNIIKDTDLVTNVELKTSIFDYKGIEEDVYKIFKAYGLLDRLIISSFNHKSLLRFKEITDLVPIAALEASKIIRPEDYLFRNGIGIYHPIFTSLDKDLVDDLHSDDIEVNAWTVDYGFDFDRLNAMGVDGIISNLPDEIMDRI